MRSATSYAEHNLSKEERTKVNLFKAKFTLVSSKESESWQCQYKSKGNESMLCMIKLSGCTSGVPCCRLVISVSGSQSTNHRGQQLPGETCPSWDLSLPFCTLERKTGTLNGKYTNNMLQLCPSPLRSTN